MEEDRGPAGAQGGKELHPGLPVVPGVAGFYAVGPLALVEALNGLQKHPVPRGARRVPEGEDHLGLRRYPKGEGEKEPPHPP